MIKNVGKKYWNITQITDGRCVVTRQHWNNKTSVLNNDPSNQIAWNHLNQINTKDLDNELNVFKHKFGQVNNEKSK